MKYKPLTPIKCKIFLLLEIYELDILEILEKDILKDVDYFITWALGITRNLKQFRNEI